MMNKPTFLIALQFVFLCTQSTYICVFPSLLCFSVSLYLSISVSSCLCIRLSLCLSVSLSLCLSVYLCVQLSLYPPVSLSLCLSVSLCLCLSVSLSLCLSVSLSLCLSVFSFEVNTVKLGYNKQLGTANLFVIAGICYNRVGKVVNMDLGPKKGQNLFVITGSSL